MVWRLFDSRFRLYYGLSKSTLVFTSRFTPFFVGPQIGVEVEIRRALGNAYQPHRSTQGRGLAQGERTRFARR